jgi:hypothetical protein
MGLSETKTRSLKQTGRGHFNRRINELRMVTNLKQYSKILEWSFARIFLQHFENTKELFMSATQCKSTWHYDIRQRIMHSDEPLETEPTSFDVEIVINHHVKIKNSDRNYLNISRGW